MIASLSSLKFVPNDSIDDKFDIGSGNKPLAKPVIDDTMFTDAASFGLDELTHCGLVMPVASDMAVIGWTHSLIGAKPLPEPVLIYFQLETLEHYTFQWNF